jgi:hypothetical protein
VGREGLADDVRVDDDGDEERVELSTPLLQVPNLDWHPEPQYAVVLPQYPYWEQQLPKTLFWQVTPDCPPQLPSVEVFSVGGAEEVVHVPNVDWQPFDDRQWSFVFPLPVVNGSVRLMWN